MGSTQLVRISLIRRGIHPSIQQFRPTIVHDGELSCREGMVSEKQSLSSLSFVLKRLYYSLGFQLATYAFHHDTPNCLRRQNLHPFIMSLWYHVDWTCFLWGKEQQQQHNE